MIAIRATGLSMLLVACVASGAGSLRVAPVRLDLPQDRRAVALTVTNTGSSSTLMQLDLKRWSQAEGNDDYSAADDLIVSPPIFTLDAGAEQVVRVGRRTAGPPAKEVAYRLFVQEVPTPGSATSPSELNVVLRISIPIFATPPNAAQSDVQWALQCREGSSPILIAVNRGGRALRVDELKVHAAGSDHAERAIYVLAGATRAFPLSDLPASTRRVELAGQSLQQKIQGAAACD